DGVSRRCPAALAAALDKLPPAVFGRDVVEEEVRRAVVCDHDVRPAVAVRVANDDAEALADGALARPRAGSFRPEDLDARLLSHVLELFPVDIAVELALSAVEITGRDVCAADTGQRGTDVEVNGRRPGDVVADEQVELAVAVVVEERAG